MIRAMLIVLCSGALNSSTLLADKPEMPEITDDSAEAKAIYEKVYGCWIEIDNVKAGKKVSSDWLSAHQYGSHNSSTWLVVGESSRSICKGGVRIDTTQSPMWMDIYVLSSDGDLRIVPGIFKLEDDTLITATPDSAKQWKHVHTSGKYPERPKNFTSTKENKYTVRTMKPTYLYGQESIEKKPKPKR